MAYSRFLIATLVFFASGCTFASSLPETEEERIDLSGTWTVKLDPEDQGIKKDWAARTLEGNEVSLPGALRESGVGHEVGPDTTWIGKILYSAWQKPKYDPYRTKENFKFPFWLQPNLHYVGPAWYQKTLRIPESWSNQRITLFLERPHWYSMVWVDGQRIGENDSLSVPHRYDLTEVLTPGRHRLTIRIDNSLRHVDVGKDAHSVSDHTQTAWHGIVGDLELRTGLPVYVSDLRVNPDAENRTVRVRARVKNKTGGSRTGTLRLRARHDGRTYAETTLRTEFPGGKKIVRTTLDLGDDAPLWDAFDPNLFELNAQIQVQKQRDRATATFGLRNLTTRGSKFVLNGRPIPFRGTLESAIFPRTGYPPTDVASWKRIIRMCKRHGLNHIRFHSWCPPRAAFRAADELGFYFQIECSSWGTLGTGQPLDDWLYREADRILDRYGNHPSFMLFAYGNEPSGPEKGAKFLRSWTRHVKQQTDNQLVTASANWPIIEENEFHVPSGPRLQHWGQGLKGEGLNGQKPSTTRDYTNVVNSYPDTPIIAHESGQWCAFPNFGEMNKYTGTLKPRNFEIFQDFLEEKGMLDRARKFVMASGKLQEICYKEEIESALRTPGFGGFQLLQLHDFPGQGTAPVGVLDPFFDPKPYHDVDRFRQYSGPTVPLVRLDRRTYTTDARLSGSVDVYHYGPDDLTEQPVRWRLMTADGTVYDEGLVTKQTLRTGGLRRVGTLSTSLDEVEAPQKLTLVVDLPQTEFRNRWDVWVYPEQVRTAAPDQVMITRSLNENTLENLSQNKNVLLMIPPERVDTSVKLGFSPIFWNTTWTKNQPPHTLGLLTDPDHPALASFPTSYHTDWQWWDPVMNAASMELGSLPEDLRPIVQVIPDWFEPKRLGLVFEAKVNGGNLLVCSIDLETNLDERPATRQLRASLLSYMSSDAFDPATNLSPEEIRGLLK